MQAHCQTRICFWFVARYISDETIRHRPRKSFLHVKPSTICNGVVEWFKKAVFLFTFPPDICKAFPFDWRKPWHWTSIDQDRTSLSLSRFLNFLKCYKKIKIPHCMQFVLWKLLVQCNIVPCNFTNCANCRNIGIIQLFGKFRRSIWWGMDHMTKHSFSPTPDSSSASVLFSPVCIFSCDSRLTILLLGDCPFQKCCWSILNTNYQRFKGPFRGTYSARSQNITLRLSARIPFCWSFHALSPVDLQKAISLNVAVDNEKRKWEYEKGKRKGD